MNRIGRLERFYEIISQLERRVGGGFTLGTLSEQANLPERGVYFSLRTANIGPVLRLRHAL